MRVTTKSCIKEALSNDWLELVVMDTGLPW